MALPHASAQNYPSKALRLISPYPPGGGTDATARIIAQALGDQMGQQMIVDSRGGASGRIGTELAAKSAPDGYTLVLGNVAPLAILPGSGLKLTYDPVKDFQPVSLIATSDYILTVHPALPARSVKELIALAKIETRRADLCIERQHGRPASRRRAHQPARESRHPARPYKGNGPAAVAILTGESQMMFGSGPSVVPHIDAGKLRALATTGSKRTLPQLPTMAELLPGYEVTQWYGILVPAGTPKEIVARLHKEIVTALGNPKIAQPLVKLGTQPVSTTPEEFAAFIKSETAKYAKVIKAAKITPE